MAAAADGFFRGLYEGCISGYNNDVERRPYHRNCGCAIHDKKSSSSSSPKATCTHKARSCSVSYPLRRAWSESCLAMAASAHSSPSSSPATATLGNCRAQMGLTDLEVED